MIRLISSRITFASFTVIVVFCLTPPSSVLARKWTSASGQFSVEAELVEVREGKVVLKKENGKQITVPLDKLSAADREHIVTLTSATPRRSNVPRSGSEADKAKPAAPTEGKSVPPHVADERAQRMEQIADETAAHTLLKHVFKDVDEEALNWVAIAGHKPKYQFAFGVFMRTRSRVLRGERHREWVKTYLDLAIARAQEQARINDLLVKDADFLKTLLHVRATSLFADDVELVALRAKNEIRYNLTITTEDAAELSKIAAQAPDEFVASHKQLRDVLLRTLVESPELQKLFPPTDIVSVELQASRKRVIDLIRTADEGSAPAANAR